MDGDVPSTFTVRVTIHHLQPYFNILSHKGSLDGESNLARRFIPPSFPYIHFRGFTHAAGLLISLRRQEAMACRCRCHMASPSSFISRFGTKLFGARNVAIICFCGSVTLFFYFSSPPRA